MPILDINQMGISLFIIAGAVLIIVGATRVYRSVKKRDKDDKTKP